MKLFSAGIFAGVAILVGTATSDAGAAGRPLNVKEIHATVSKGVHEIRQCYSRYAKKQRGATGQVLLEMEVNSQGKVVAGSAKVSAEGVKGRKFGLCAEGKVYEWRFPADRKPTVIQYPLKFVFTRAPGAGPGHR